MKKLTFESYTTLDIDKFVTNLREADKLEAYAMGYDSLKEAIQTSLDCAYISFVARAENGEAICIFGLSSVTHSEYGRAVWFLGAKEMDGYSKEFVYYSKIIIKEMLKNNERLYNYISVHNDKSIRWLKRLGAEFSEPFSLNGEEFLLFILGGD